MTQITINTNNSERKLSVNHFLHEALERERNILMNALRQVQTELEKFEHKYKISTSFFYEQYQSGLLDDREDYIDWSGEYRMYQTLSKRLSEFEDVVVY